MASKYSIFFSLLLAQLQITEVASQAFTQNITLSGPTLSPYGPYSYMTSPSSEFSFGFQSTGSNSLFLLAIWFNKTSTQPIIWFATNSSGTGVPVLAPAGSKLELTQTGELLLTGPTSEKIWSPGPGRATHFTLLDKGNAILYDDSEVPLWQTFDSPTDTLIPGQSLSKGSALLSKLSDSDFSPGRFTVEARIEGYLAFYLALKPSDPTSTPYWAANDDDSGMNLVFNQSGFLYYELANSSFPFNINQSPSTRYYQHATIDPDGVFRVYVYDKNLLDKGDWSVVRELPVNACSIHVGIGSGMCGFNAYCTESSNSKLPRLNCMCPQKYSFIDASRPYLGCQPDFALQNCSVDETSNFMLMEMKNTNWYDGGDYMHFFTEDENECKTSCLTDCFCSVSIYFSTNCWKKKLPLSNGRQTINTPDKAFIKVRVSDTNQSLVPIPSSCNRKGQTNLVVIAAVLLGTAILVLLAAVAIVSIYLLHSKRCREITTQVNPNPMGINMKIFSYKDLQDATNEFAEVLGKGTFGIVYKGTIQTGDHPVSVAVKKLELEKDGDREFTNEVQSVGQIHHKNLVRLLGFCNEGPHRMLVYEYMSNGSLINFIFGAQKLGWSIRAQIALGIARGLCYLHEGCSSQIIHCDIKPQNILLDDNLVARIADFGISKLLSVDQTRAAYTHIWGTRGYLAPEWFNKTGATPKMDVFSFGVMLLEIVCCRRCFQLINEEYSVLNWVYDCLSDGSIDVLIQWDEEAENDIDRVESFLKVAIWCIQDNPATRPTMHQVTQMLAGEMAIAPPPAPIISLSH